MDAVSTYKKEESGFWSGFMLNSDMEVANGNNGLFCVRFYAVFEAFCVP